MPVGIKTGSKIHHLGFMLSSRMDIRHHPYAFGYSCKWLISEETIHAVYLHVVGCTTRTELSVNLKVRGWKMEQGARYLNKQKVCGAEFDKVEEGSLFLDILWNGCIAHAGDYRLEVATPSVDQGLKLIDECSCSYLYLKTLCYARMALTWITTDLRMIQAVADLQDEVLSAGVITPLGTILVSAGNSPRSTTTPEAARKPQSLSKSPFVKGYNVVGWMVVTLEMEVGSGGRVHLYGHQEWHHWLANVGGNQAMLQAKHFFDAVDHVEDVYAMDYKLQDRHCDKRWCCQVYSQWNDTCKQHLHLRFPPSDTAKAVVKHGHTSQ
ncbi:hypothetical protein F5146DRAFT_1004019 [Armillaria mellea]|nr:hypothetical protein F5146DRAFT_1004019 [Armillaria mellea]